MNIRVTHCVKIRNNSVIKDAHKIFESASVSFSQFADLLYQEMRIGYPKFHKMDNLSKLGFLCADILLKNNTLEIQKEPFKTGIILSNRNSSLDTDKKYFNMVRTGIASPAVFVYSLPNIVIGEICIRHGIKGENTFFIEKEYNIPHQVNYISNLFQSGSLKACIGGWVELLGDNYDCFLYLVENNLGKNGIPYSTENISKLYTTPQ